MRIRLRPDHVTLLRITSQLLVAVPWACKIYQCENQEISARQEMRLLIKFPSFIATDTPNPHTPVYDCEKHQPPLDHSFQANYMYAPFPGKITYIDTSLTDCCSVVGDK
jgi:hypothetical protein